MIKTENKDNQSQGILNHEIRNQLESTITYQNELYRISSQNFEFQSNLEQRNNDLNRRLQEVDLIERSFKKELINVKTSIGLKSIEFERTAKITFNLFKDLRKKKKNIENKLHSISQQILKIKEHISNLEKEEFDLDHRTSVLPKDNFLPSFNGISKSIFDSQKHQIQWYSSVISNLEKDISNTRNFISSSKKSIQSSKRDMVDQLNKIKNIESKIQQNKNSKSKLKSLKNSLKSQDKQRTIILSSLNQFRSQQLQLTQLITNLQSQIIYTKFQIKSIYKLMQSISKSPDTDTIENIYEKHQHEQYQTLFKQFLNIQKQNSKFRLKEKNELIEKIHQTQKEKKQTVILKENEKKKIQHFLDLESNLQKELTKVLQEIQKISQNFEENYNLISSQPKESKLKSLFDDPININFTSEELIISARRPIEEIAKHQIKIEKEIQKEIETITSDNSEIQTKIAKITERIKLLENSIYRKQMAQLLYEKDIQKSKQKMHADNSQEIEQLKKYLNSLQVLVKKKKESLTITKNSVQRKKLILKTIEDNNKRAKFKKSLDPFFSLNSIFLHFQNEKEKWEKFQYNQSEHCEMSSWLSWLDSVIHI